MVKKYSCILNGGIGKHIVATSMLRFIKQKEPDAEITIVSAFPEIFLNNPNVKKNLFHMTSYIYDDYLQGTDYRTGDPYTFSEYYERKNHLAELFPVAYRFNEMNNDIYPEIYLSSQEMKEAGHFMKQSPKPVITIQLTGGNQRMGQMKDPLEMTSRDLSVEQGQKIVDLCVSQGFNVLQVALPHEIKLRNVLNFENVPFRKYIGIIPFIKGHIGIDSAMMHAVAAFRKHALIFWNNTNVKNLGYPYMTNINQDICKNPMCGRPHVGIPDLVPEGAWVCPENRKCQNWKDEDLTKNVNSFLLKLKSEVVQIPLDDVAPKSDCVNCLK